jgi:nicotinamide phosphoribosyltransferase
MNRNLLLMADGYKYSQFPQFDPRVTGMYSYIAARSCSDTRIKGILAFGLQAFIKEYLMKPIMQMDIDEAEDNIVPYMGKDSFPKAAFDKLLRVYEGRWPVIIKSVPEGTIVPLGAPIASIECYDRDIFPISTMLETALLRALWYPSTVATWSKLCKSIISDALHETSDNHDALLPTRLHDFGARGASSHETAALGGMAHLVNFIGSDTVEGIIAAKRYYSADDTVAISIPASEHSTITSWGRDSESKAYANMIEKFSKPGSIYACVSDSYDIFNAVENIWGGELKDQVIKSGGTLVVRPDSGDPISTCLKVVKILDEKFGSVPNSKGYKVLNNVRIIQGDGITPDMIRSILFAFQINGYAADNIAFGMGGALLQKVTRDDFGFAQKCSMVYLDDGSYRPVYKDPVGGNKTSRKGFQALVKTDTGLQAVSEETGAPVPGDILIEKYNGVKSPGKPAIYVERFSDIRTRSNES